MYVVHDLHYYDIRVLHTHAFHQRDLREYIGVLTFKWIHKK